MAFTTQAGATSSDYTTLTGSSLADSVALTTNLVEIEAKGGNDTVSAADAKDKIKIDAGEGSDTVTFSGDLTGADFNLGLGNDTANLQDLSGSILGGDGADSLQVNRSGSKATLSGSDGNDTITVVRDFTTGSVLAGGKDNDAITVTGTLNGSTIYGGKNDDAITVTAGIDKGLVRGDNNRDTINVAGTLSNATVSGGSENDAINVTATTISNSSVWGGKGNDTVTLTNAAAIYVSADKNDDTITVVGGTSAHSLDGGDGNDTITDVGGASSLKGGAGADTITTGAGNDTVLGGAGADSVQLDGGLYEVRGGTDADTIMQTALAQQTALETIAGDGGTDVLLFQAADGVMTDGVFTNTSTVETLDFDDATATGLTLTLEAKAQAAGIVTVDMRDNDGSGGAVTSTVNFSAYTVGATYLGTLDNAANANDDIENVTGGTGADSFLNSSGVANFTGGTGNDTFEFAEYNGASTVTDLATGDVLRVVADPTAGVLTATTAGFAATSSTTNVANLFSDVAVTTTGSATAGKIDMDLATGTRGYDLSHTGTGTATSIVGSDFADRITALAGVNDTLSGGAGADSLVGGTGADSLSAGAGADSVISASGADNVALGTGTNTLVFATPAAALAAALEATNAEITAYASDTITGYSVANDSVQVSRALFGTRIGTAGNALAATKFSTIATGATASLNFTAVNNGFVYVQNTDKLYYSIIDLSAAGSVATAITNGTIAEIGTFNDIALVATEISVIA